MGREEEGMLSRRNLLLAGAIAAPVFGQLSRAIAQSPVPGPGPDGGGTDVFPGGYAVRAEAVPAGPKTFVDVKQGRLEGVAAGGVRHFRGVPYAESPVGALRFKQPVMKQPWAGTRQATVNPPGPMQTTLLAEAATSEDCLYLNVWAPQTPGPHPVYVFIHGGAYTAGYSLEYRIKGASFVRDGIVLVTIGYRVGALGFLELGGLLGPDYAGSGNNGIRDQQMALRWIKENIGAFGGDPSKITVGGQSAGAGSVVALLSAPSSEGLFRGAVVQSGGSRARTAETARAGADAFAKEVTAAGGDPRKLADLPVDVIMRAQAKSQGGWGPFIDGDFLPYAPLDAMRKGVNAKVHLMIG